MIARQAVQLKIEEVMEKYIKYIDEFQDGNEYGKYFLENQLSQHIKTGSENSTDIEHILDFVYSCKKKYKNLGYSTILEKANAWSKKLQASASSKEKEKEGVDIETVFKSGTYRVVKLISKKAYAREGKLMSHCVSSYSDRGFDVFSLRDNSNKPHCTICKQDHQIKGKGNGKINPKYIKCVVAFLEHMEIDVSRDMENLGYVDISCIKDVEFPKSSVFRDKWFFLEDIHKIKDKDHLSLIKLNKGFFDKDFNEVIDLDKAIGREIARDYSTATARDNSIATARNCSTATAMDCSTATAKNCSTATARDNSIATAMNCSTATARDNSIATARNCSTATARNYSTATARDSSTATAMDCSTATARNYSTATARDYSTATARDYSTATARNYSTATAMDYSTATARDYSTAIVGKHSIATLRNKGRAKGDLGSVITLCECNEKNEVIAFKSFQIDGEKWKANVFYEMVKGEVREC